MNKKYTIAVCDILGFSELVKQHPLDQVMVAVDVFLKSVYHSIHKADFPIETPSFERLRNNASVGVAVFSDTILLYTRHDDDDCMKALITAVGWLIFETIVGDTATCIRCGIAYGEAHIDPENSMYVGKPIVEAAELEKKQEWSGGALAPSAMKRLPDGAKDHLLDWWLTPYEIPIKRNAAIEPTFAINWTVGIHSKRLKERWWGPNRCDSSTKAVQEKWENTRSFHDIECQHCPSWQEKLEAKAKLAARQDHV